MKVGVAVCGTVIGLVAGGWAQAQAVELSFKASPDFYKVVTENDQYRVIEAKWKPGQRDKMHSHPAHLYYWVTPCTIRWHLPDGKTRDVTVEAGRAGLGQAVAAHEVENIAKSDCTILMFEPK
jgi:beta-alanine degradation protein BauB